MTRSLDAVEGVRKAPGQQSIEDQQALILEYIDGETLRDHIVRKILSLRAKLEIAVDLTRILENIHQQEVIHLDLNSKNILIGKEDQVVRLIDLGSAFRIIGNAHQKVRPDQILGSLQYISPEQTGKINRAVDERSDLYSLGVILYELVTGQLPFDSKNPMELIHHHIARIPVSPSEVLPEIPEVISSIILKLLTKNAEDRYQSAAGVRVDLEKCLQCLRPDNTIEGFPVGEADYSSRLTFPQKLYGRESELKELMSAFKRACRETSSIMFVNGYSGIGKTALVEEIQRPVSEKRGYFIEGKFDQYLRTTPYTAITQAFTALVTQILTEPEKNFNKWRDKIQAAVGDLGKVLTGVIPAMEELIGSQPDVPQLGGQEAENRFNYVFINFLLSVAIEMHPLVLFIDDLQWIDAASLRLLKVIKSDFNQSGLLVIGAYRDNEVNASHPLMEIIGDGEKKGMLLRILKLENLQQQHLEKLLSDTLRSQEGIKGLGENIYKKTQGNPFFTRRLLSSLHEEGHIRYEFGTNSWKLDIVTLNKEVIAENVADLLAKSIAQLPDETIDILKLAACIGNRFDIQTLAIISGLAEQEVVKLLTVSLSGQYVFESGDTFEFVHDQVQQAGYALVAEEDRPQVHLEIGRTLLSHKTEAEQEEALFDIVHHFNASAPLLESESEKVTVAELDLKAARKAKSATAYAEGFAYVVQGLALLDTDSWQHHYDLTLAMHNEAAELSYLTGHYDRLDETEGRIHKNAQSILDRARVYYIRTMIDTDQGRLLESIETGIGALAELGITVPREPSPEDIERAEAAFTEALATRSVEELAHLPAMTDRGALAAMEIMAAVLLNAYIASPQHLSLLTHRGASLSLQHGNGPWSPFFYSVVGLLRAGAVDISPTGESAQGLEEAQKLGKVLLSLLENPKYARCKAKALEAMMGGMNLHRPLSRMLDRSLEIYKAGLDTGDLLNAALGIYHFANYGLASGMNLEDYQKTVLAYRQSVKDLEQEYMYRTIGIGLQTAQNLMTPGSGPDVLEGRHLDERQWLPDAVATNDGFTLFLVFQAKLWLSYHFDRDGRLMEYAGEAEKYLDNVYGMINIVLFRFYDSLSRLRLYSSLSADERELALKRVESNQLRMRIWAQNGPMNFQHKFDLVAAEKARVSGNIGPAIENYERAIEGARDNEFIHEEALANELYARFWQKRGNDKIAEMYMREARVLYHQWGANAKVSHLENRYPQWFKARTIPREQPDTPDSAATVQTSLSQSITPIQMDLDSIISASQTLSSETNLEQLLIKMMELVMANSGAEKAVLLLKQGVEWFVQARGDSTNDKYDILLNQSFDPADSETDLIPEPVFNYCQRSREVLVVGDTELDPRFAEDRMIQTHNIKSIACIPVLNRGELKAMLYLENRQMSDVFTMERVEILKHLSSQFGVSAENALLYDNLTQAEAKYRTVADFTYDWEYWASMDGTLNYVSPSCERVSGYSVQDFMDNPSLFREIIVPEDREIWDRHYHDSRQELKPQEIQFRIKRRDGEIHWIEHLCQAVIDDQGRLQGFRASNRDITERKQAEMELRRAYEEIKQLKDQLEAESAYLQEEIKAAQSRDGRPHGFSCTDHGGNRDRQRAYGPGPSQTQSARQTDTGEGKLRDPARGID
jgi:PAS domain S-box-containing protein